MVAYEIAVGDAIWRAFVQNQFLVLVTAIFFLLASAYFVYQNLNPSVNINLLILVSVLICCSLAVLTKRYGQLFIDALPTCTVVRQRLQRIPELLVRWLDSRQ